MWITRRAENKGQRRAGGNHGPVCGRIETVPPGIRPLDFTAIEVDHGGVEFRGRHTTHQCAGRFGRAVVG
jgi:hypothetical protein